MGVYGWDESGAFDTFESLLLGLFSLGNEAAFFKFYLGSAKTRFISVF